MMIWAGVQISWPTLAMKTCWRAVAISSAERAADAASISIA
jgi:hypothetical protein